MLHILEPFKIGEITVKNRLVMPPMCMYSADERGFVEDFHIVHYASRALGGVGTIIVEATAVLPEGRISENDLGIWSDEHIKGHEKLASVIEKYGAVPAIQLAHAGRKSETKGDIYAPSSLKYSDEYKEPIAMTKRDIENTTAAFKNGFIRAKKSGYKLIEIHAAHGYLLNEFLSPLTNKREDEYGSQSHENRFRIVNEIIREIRNIDDKTPLAIRFSATDYVNGGNTVEDVVIFSKMAKEAGIDLIDVSSGGVSADQKLKVYPGYQVSFAKEIKDKVGISTIAVGMITTLEQSEHILAENFADLVAMGRNLLRDPYFFINRLKSYDIELSKKYYPRQYLRSFEIL